ncbi:MAG: hypothetical protein ACREPT_08650 [Rudaea sp.]
MAKLDSGQKTTSRTGAMFAILGLHWFALVADREDHKAGCCRTFQKREGESL